MTTRTLDVGIVLKRIWRHYSNQFGVLFPAALIVFAIADLLGGISQKGGGTAGALVASAISTIATYWYQGVVIKSVSEIRDHVPRHSIGQLFGSIEGRLWPLIAAGILAGIGVTIGFVLLIIPGFILLTWWAVVAPAIVVEHRPIFDSFKRSQELVKGSAWQVLAVVITVTIISAIVVGVLVAIGAAWTTHNFVGYWIGAWIAHAIVAPMTGLAAAILYYELVGLKEKSSEKEKSTEQEWDEPRKPEGEDGSIPIA